MKKDYRDRGQAGMDVLYVIRNYARPNTDGPNVTYISDATNIEFSKINGFLRSFLSKGLIVGAKSGQNSFGYGYENMVYRITDSGRELLDSYMTLVSAAPQLFKGTVVVRDADRQSHSHT